MRALSEPVLAVVTDRTRLAPRWALAQAVAEAVTGGANLVILNEPDLPRPALATLARFLRDGIAGRASWVLVGSAESARACGADGALVGVGDLAAARHALGESGLLGAIVRSESDARAAIHADFFYAAVDWAASDTLSLVTALCRAASVPVIAGMDPTPDQARAARAAGAAGIALCQGPMAAEHRAALVREYLRSAADPDHPLEE